MQIFLFVVLLLLLDFPIVCEMDLLMETGIDLEQASRHAQKSILADFIAIRSTKGSLFSRLLHIVFCFHHMFELLVCSDVAPCVFARMCCPIERHIH